MSLTLFSSNSTSTFLKLVASSDITVDTTLRLPSNSSDTIAVLNGTQTFRTLTVTGSSSLNSDLVVSGNISGRKGTYTSDLTSNSLTTGIISGTKGTFTSDLTCRQFAATRGTYSSDLVVTPFNGNRILLSNTSKVITESSALTNGQLLIGSTGAAPTAANVSAGGGILVTNGAGSISVATKRTLTLYWMVRNCAANTTTVASFMIPTTNDATFSIGAILNVIKVHTSGSVISGGIINSANVTAGTISLQANINGSTNGTAIATLSTTNPRSYTGTVASGTITFTADQTIGADLVTNVAYTPTSADYTVWLQIEFDS